VKRKVVICPNSKCRTMQLNIREYCVACSVEMPEFYQETRPRRREYTLGDLLLLDRLERGKGCASPK